MWKSTLLIVLLALPMSAAAQRLALSFDDGFDPIAQPRAATLNASLLRALAEHKVRTIFFVAGSRVDSAVGLKLMQDWSDAGHLLANHGYSHLNLNSPEVTLEQFIEDVVKNESLLASLPRAEKRFRFPYLKEGGSEEKRDGFRQWLLMNNYASGAVSIDASDWYYDRRLRAWLDGNPEKYPSAFREPYMAHLLDRANYYSSLARQALGRDVDHVMLLHTNTINAYFLPDIIAMFRAAGWEIIDPAEAYQDAVYATQPQVLPAGESIIWSLARQAGLPDLRYPAEDGRYEEPKLDALGL
jgi:peptidoglycan/xylan/chitin deacetylase (PgdA/CDA1 family)